MLITFTSPAAPKVLMFGDDALPLLEVMGKARSAPGVVTVEQLGEALRLLRRAADASRNASSTARQGGESTDDPSDQPGCDRRSSISLWQRAQPLIELLERSQRAGKPVVWR